VFFKPAFALGTAYPISPNIPVSNQTTKENIIVNPQFKVNVTTDGTAADVKIEQERNKRNMNSIENTHRTQRLSN
jgi:hypothetical protein